MARKGAVADEAAIRPAGRTRTTRQSAAIEQVLREADGFRTAQELFDAVRNSGHKIGLTTVYRHLNLLAELGSADIVHRGDGEAQFRLCGPTHAAGLARQRASPPRGLPGLRAQRAGLGAGGGGVG